MRNLYAGFFVVVLFVLSALAGYGQETRPARNTFYAQLSSQASPYSLNYDRIFHIGEKLSYAFRVGFALNKNDISAPLGISAFTGKGDHHFEFGGILIPYVYMPKTENKSNNSDLYLYLIPHAGYRYQRKNGGLFFKANAGPSIFCDPPSDNFWNMQPKLQAYGSLSLGFSF